MISQAQKMALLPKLTGRRCLCTDCGRLFNSPGGFEGHRIGNIAKGTRHCLDDNELQKRGYEPNDGGFWRIPMPDKGQIVG